MDEAIASTRELLVNSGRIIPRDWLKAKEMAGGRLSALVQHRFERMLDLLAHEIGSVNSAFRFSRTQLSAPLSPQTKVVAERLGYDPDFSQFDSSWAFRMEAPSGVTSIVVSFHGTGAAFRGLIVCSAFLQVGQNDPVVLCDDVFRVSYDEDPAKVENRFQSWLEPCLVKGIALWRGTLA